MARKDKLKNKNNGKEKSNKEKVIDSVLSSFARRWIKATLMFLLTIIALLSFPYFDKAGWAGKMFVTISQFLIGRAMYAIPLFLFVSGLIFLKTKKRGKNLAMVVAILISLIGMSGILASRDLTTQIQGGWVGYYLATLFTGLFGILVDNIIFGAIMLVGFFIFFQFLWQEFPRREEEEKPTFALNNQAKDELKIRNFDKQKEEKSKLLPSRIGIFQKNREEPEKKEILKAPSAKKTDYVLPPLDLLNKNEVAPTSGNIKENSMIIKGTLENFGIPVEMAEVNVGPTVTQYAFKPAEGVKLSKITTLSNNLALALAAHPIRIEAPIPGKSMVGIEVPNKVRSVVSLRNLFSSPSYQNPQNPLLIALGRDVSGEPVYTDIAEGPHVLVAGATGTGKTIFLNSLILSLLYRASPEQLRIIMVDPKRVEFQSYNGIPHLLCPVIYDAQKTINALHWLIKEMERRFEVFSEVPTRNIATYNTNKSVVANNAQLPYIVFVVDELADLMAAKGRDLEAGIVRLAQMARATGIHLVLATQRPSVEVITGLIKANVPTRITFQVASQVDSRTVLDTSGAEKLLGNGDMLFLSAKSSKIGRIQGPFVSEKEVKKVAEFIQGQSEKVQDSQSVVVESLKTALERQDERELGSGGEVFFGEEDPLFEDVKQIVLETKKASASILQRRLRVGYSRAARLIDMLEEKGIVGPADGAKPREVYGSMADLNASPLPTDASSIEEKGNDEEWQKI